MAEASEIMNKYKRYYALHREQKLSKYHNDPEVIAKREAREVKRAEKEAEITSETSFIDVWDGVECSMEVLYDKYVSHCQDKKIHYAGNSKLFGIKLLEFIRDGMLKERKSDGKMVYSK